MKHAVDTLEMENYFCYISQILSKTLFYPLRSFNE